MYEMVTGIENFRLLVVAIVMAAPWAFVFKPYTLRAIIGCVVQMVGLGILFFLVVKHLIIGV